jgi:anti-anti-sigma factor
MDTMVTDLNNKKNIVGTGINLAQRIMNLGRHGQILMHSAVAAGLESDANYKYKLRPLGEYIVKHGMRVPITQYVDSDCEYINNDPPACATAVPPKIKRVTLPDIRRSRIRETMLEVELKGADREAIPDVREYLEDSLDEAGVFTNHKIAVTWIASELLDNAYRYGELSPGDSVVLALDKTRQGIEVRVMQPDSPAFDISGAIHGYESENHFLALMNNRGIQPRLTRDRGRMTVSCEISENFTIRPVEQLSGSCPAEIGEAGKMLEGIMQDAAKEQRMVVTRDIYNTTLVIVSGKLDTPNAACFEEQVLKVLDNGSKGLIFEFSRVEYICSTAMRSLMFISKELKRRNNGRMALLNPGKRIIDLLDLTGCTSMFPIANDLFAALAAVS